MILDWAFWLGVNGAFLVGFSLRGILDRRYVRYLRERSLESEEARAARLAERARCVEFVEEFEGGWLSCHCAAEALEKGETLESHRAKELAATERAIAEGRIT